MTTTRESDQELATVRAPLAARASLERQRRRRSTAAVWLARACIVVLAVGGWHVMGTTSPSWSIVISTPWDVAGKLIELLGTGAWWTDVWVTLREAVGGYFLGLAISVVLVAVFVPFKPIADFSAPFIAMLNATPNVALAPLFIVWFGFGYTSKLVYVATSTFFISFYGIYVGIRQIDRVLLDNCRIYGASRFELIKEVYAPAIATWVLGGLRVAAAWAVLAAVVAEFLGSRQGVGFRVATASQSLQQTTVIAIIIFIAAGTFLIDRILVRVERNMSRWRLF